MRGVVTVSSNAKKVLRQATKAVNRAYGQHIYDTQAKFVRANPKESGRMASSWKCEEGSYTDWVRPESWNEDGASPVVTVEWMNPDDANIDDQWFLTNTVIYAHRLATDPKWSHGGEVGGSDWYTAIVNANSRLLDEALQKAWNKIP